MRSVECGMRRGIRNVECGLAAGMNHIKMYTNEQGVVAVQYLENLGAFERHAALPSL
jgi:hypothetical protein